MSLSDSFQFPVGSEQDAQVCANVSIEDDGLQELLEAFIVTLNSTMDGVSIENTDILVFIVDNDVGKMRKLIVNYRGCIKLISSITFTPSTSFHPTIIQTQIRCSSKEGGTEET